MFVLFFFFFSSRRRHTRSDRDWSSDVCSSDLKSPVPGRHPRRAPKLWKLAGSSPGAAPCSCSTMGELAARSPRTVLAGDERRENALLRWDAWELLPWSPHITYPASRPCAVRERSYLRTDRTSNRLAFPKQC